MSLSSWRQFPFFEGTPIKDPYLGSGTDALYSDPTISAVGSVGEYIAIATRQCHIKLIDSQLTNRFEFQCYDEGWTITRIAYFNQRTTKRHNHGHHEHSSNFSFLVTIAEKQGFPTSLKLWNLNKLLDPKYNMKKFDFNSSYHTICQVANGANNYPLTSFAFLPDYSAMAFGFSNGAIFLVRGDLLHDRGSKQRVIYESKEPITSLHFKDELSLFVTTVSSVFTILTTGKNGGNIEKLLESKEGADIDCTDVMKEQHSLGTTIVPNSLVVARPECFQFYNSNGRSHSIQIHIPKRNIHLYNNRYLLCLTTMHSNLSDSAMFSSNKLLIIDMRNNFIVFNQSISGSIVDIFEIWDDLYVLLTDGSLLRLHEKPLKDNVSVLVNNDLFQIAFKLIEENPQQFSPDEVMDLRRRYGQYLYDKHEYSDSIDQFMECIPLGKTSEIISKFKESTKIPLLVKYLEKMVALKITVANHINLLLTSYCKLQASEKFKDFIENIKLDGDYEIDVVEKYKTFDLNMIIELCKENEMYNLALLVAEKFNLSSTVVSVQLHNIGNPASAINYVQTLSIDDLLRVLIDNVSELLNFLPNETTQLLIDVFTGKYKPKTRTASRISIEQYDNHESSLSSHPLLTSYKQFVSFMKLNQRGETENSLPLTDEMSGNSTPTENIEGEHDSSSLASDNTDENKPTYQPPRPRIIFSSFVNHDYEFVIFLEACIESYDKFGGNEQDKNDLINTLYEMYLTLSKMQEESTSAWTEKAANLLRNRKEWTEEDKITILMISNTYGFNEGEIIVREITEESQTSMDGLELDLFRAAIFSDDIMGSYDIVKRYGSKEVELYRLALITYTSNNHYIEILGEDNIKKLLEIIEQSNSLTPLEVLECMTDHKATNASADVKLGLVKDYLLRTVDLKKTEIQENEKVMTAYEHKLTDLTQQIEELLTTPKIINTTKCSVCNMRLDFPIVYFKCGHQVHESCLIEASTNNSNLLMEDVNNGTDSLSCPVCAVDQDALQILKRQQRQVAMRQDVFMSSLKSSNDRFKTMFSFLGRGGMEPAKVVLDGNSI